MTFPVAVWLIDGASAGRLGGTILAKRKTENAEATQDAAPIRREVSMEIASARQKETTDDFGVEPNEVAQNPRD